LKLIEYFIVIDLTWHANNKVAKMFMMMIMLMLIFMLMLKWKSKSKWK